MCTDNYPKPSYFMSRITFYFDLDTLSTWKKQQIVIS